MSRVFTSAADLADHLEFKVAPRLAREFAKGLETAGKIAKKTAFDMIGHDQPGLWDKLKDSTIRIKRNNNWGLRGNPASPLYATGEFRKSIWFRTDPAASSVTIGSDVPYVVFTEYGTARMPARPVFRPAAERSGPEILAKVGQALHKALEA